MSFLVQGLYIAICSTLLVVCSAVPTSRIINGTDADVGKFPFIVSVRRDHAHVCGGSIISENYILTAAHCVCELRANPIPADRISIRAGSVNLFAGGKIYYVEEVRIHKSYGNTLNDIAVLKLVSNLTLGPRVQVIELAKPEDEVKPGDVGMIAGWGSTQSGGQHIYKLLEGSTTAVTEQDCEEAIGYGYPSVICLRSEKGYGTCHGDAGGPAVFKDKLVGVSNLVIGACGTGYPDVYARVSYFLPWIQDLTGIA